MKRVAAVNDLSGLGKCSLTAAIPVLSALGVQACPVPTAVLTAQTGFPVYSLRDGTEAIAQYIADWTALGKTFDGIYTGFLAGTHQVKEVLSFADAFCTVQTVLLVDPVMGDDGQLYGPYDAEYCAAMGTLVQRADIVTPNLTEACLLTGTDYAALTAHCDEPDYGERVFALAQKLQQQGPHCVIITGIHEQGRVSNLILDGDSRHVISSRAIANARYSGTGDLFASVICGGAMRGWDAKRSAQLAVRFLEEALGRTVKSGTDRAEGVEFETSLHLLTEAIVHENENTDI